MNYSKWAIYKKNENDSYILPDGTVMNCITREEIDTELKDQASKWDLFKEEMRINREEN